MTAAECGGEIAIFDLLSHADMHHAFNEGYIRTVKAAFPESSISFHACEGQIRYLSRLVADLDKVTLTPCPAFKMPFGLSRHNPVAGNLAALQCLRTLRRLRNYWHRKLRPPTTMFGFRLFWIGLPPILAGF